MKRALLFAVPAALFGACWNFDELLSRRCASGELPNCTPPALPAYDVTLPTAPICLEAWCAENPFPHALDITALWGAGPQDVWLGTHAGLVMHYDRGSWSVRDAGLTTVAEIWGRGATEVYFVGGDHKPVLFDGRGFKDTGSNAGPLPSYAVAGTPTTLYWGTTPYLMRQSGGDEFTVAFTATGQQVKSIAASSDSECHALVGPGDSNNRVLVRCDGGSETDAGELDVLWPGTNGALWAGGINRLVQLTPPAATTPLGFNVRDGFAIPGGNDVIAVGETTHVYRREGAPVERKLVPSDDGRALLAVWSSGADDIWVGGQAGLLYHWNGDKDVWQPVHRGTLNDFYGIAPSPKGLLAVGVDGLIFRTDAGLWEKSGYEADGNIRAISLLPDGGGYAVGRHIHTLFGVPDAVMETPNDELTGVFTRSEDDAWAVGNEVWQRTSAGWAQRADIRVPPQGLYAVAGAAQRAWAVGRESDAGALVYELFPDGGFRQETNVTPNVEVRAIWMLPDGGFIAGGLGCTIWESSWTSASSCSMTAVTLFGAWSDGANSWLVGDQGVVVNRFMGVNKLVPTGLGGSSRFTGVTGLDGKGVWITGTHGIVMHHP
jgi:hypothetical protein